MRRKAIVIGVLAASINQAHAIECQTSMRGGDSYWAWRLIDGRQCWYKGERGMDKSLLHWPSPNDGQNKREITVGTTQQSGKTQGLGKIQELGKTQELDRTQEERAQVIPEVAPVPPELLKMLPIMPLQPSFGDRWRLQ
jgi:hypothetical protein